MRKALALLATLVLFVAHTPTAAYAAGEINNYLDLKQACQSGGSYVLNADITYDASDPDCGVDPDYPSSGYPAYPLITGVSGVTIDLNGHTIDANNATNAFCVDDGSPAVDTSFTSSTACASMTRLITSQNDTAPKLPQRPLDYRPRLITSQNDTAPKRLLVCCEVLGGLITSQNDTAPKR